MNRAELFRLAKAGRLSLKRISFYGITKEDLLAKQNNNEELTGWELRSLKSGAYDSFRKVTKVSGDAFNLESSWLDLAQASLLTITDSTITQHKPGLRPLTPEERMVMDEWTSISSTPEFKQQSYYDAISDGSTTYWQERSFFKKKDMEHLLGLEFTRGCKLDVNSHDKEGGPFVFDKKIKGEVLFEYEYKAD